MKRYTAICLGVVVVFVTAPWQIAMGFVFAFAIPLLARIADEVL